MSYYLDKYKYCPLCKGTMIKGKESIECVICKNKIFDNGKPAVNVIIENDKGELLLTTRKINPFKGWLDFPGGFLQSGETLEECGKREVKEEVGIDVEIGKYLGSYTVEYEYGEVFYKLVTAFFEGRGDTSKIVVGDDVSKFKFVPKSLVLKEKFCYPDANKSALKNYLRIND